MHVTAARKFFFGDVLSRSPSAVLSSYGSL